MYTRTDHPGDMLTFWVGVTDHGGPEGSWRFVTDNTTFSADAAQYQWDKWPRNRNGGSNRSRLCLTMHPARYDDKEVLEKYDCSIKKYGLCEKKGLQ